MVMMPDTDHDHLLRPHARCPCCPVGSVCLSPGIAESYYDCDTYTTTDSSTPLIDALYAAGQLDHDIFTISFCGATVRLSLSPPRTLAGPDTSQPLACT